MNPWISIEFLYNIWNGMSTIPIYNESLTARVFEDHGHIALAATSIIFVT